MSFSYHNCDGTQDNIDLVRLLISDTVDLNHIFEDSEITGAYRVTGFQSSQFYSGLNGAVLPSAPVPYRRVAATLLTSLASNKSRLSSITQLLDVHLSPSVAAKSLRDQAQSLLDQDDNDGSFAIIEQVNGVFSFRERFWHQDERLGGLSA